MAEDEGRAPETAVSEPKEETIPFSERKGIDTIDSSIPPVDQFRPTLDAPQSSGEGDGGQR